VDFLCALTDDPDAAGVPDVTPETVLRHGTGQKPSFHGVITEYSGEAVGFLLCHFNYWAEDALPSLHMADLFVREAARGWKVGIGADDESHPDIPPEWRQTDVVDRLAPEPGGHRFLQESGRSLRRG